MIQGFGAVGALGAIVAVGAVVALGAIGAMVVMVAIVTNEKVVVPCNLRGGPLLVQGIEGLRGKIKRENSGRIKVLLQLVH